MTPEQLDLEHIKKLGEGDLWTCDNGLCGYVSPLVDAVQSARKERDEARKWLEGICSEFEGAVAHADWRAAGSKGMSVPFTGDFASVVQLPGAINKMRWWVKVFRAVLNGEKP